MRSSSFPRGPNTIQPTTARIGDRVWRIVSATRSQPVSSCSDAKATWNTTPVTAMHTTATIRITRNTVDDRNGSLASIQWVTATAMFDCTVKKQKKLNTFPCTLPNEPPSAVADSTSWSTSPPVTSTATAANQRLALSSLAMAGTLRRLGPPRRVGQASVGRAANRSTVLPSGSVRLA